ncbi:MAG: oxidoreductase, partial [bacterium]|nr:oxidoreductase [bacterium]
PGSEGLKTPNMYLPKDVCQAINTCLGSDEGLDYEDRLASDNEVKNIQSMDSLKAKLVPHNKLLSQLVTKQLGEQACTKLYDALSSLINEKRQFQKNWSPTWFGEDGFTPTGIQEISSVMDDASAGKNNVQRLARIFEIVLERPVVNVTRTAATSSVYERIRGLCAPLKHGDKALNAEAVEKEWLRLFEASKGERSGSSLEVGITH